MNPLKSLIQPPIITLYIPPKNLNPTALEDWEEGGIALSDGSAGLQYQVWHLQVLGDTINTAIYLSSPNTASTLIFAKPNITWARLAFDQNMHPVISYVDITGPAFYWFDPLLPGNTFTSLPPDATTPCVTMDDKRELQTRQGNNDVVMTYVRLGNLYYRIQRERYNIEHVWYANISHIIANPTTNKIGMSEEYRLTVEISGSLYQ